MMKMVINPIRATSAELKVHIRRDSKHKTLCGRNSRSWNEVNETVSQKDICKICFKKRAIWNRIKIENAIDRLLGR